MSVNPQPPSLLWREVPLFIIFLFMSAGIMMAQQWDAGVGVWLIPSIISVPIALLCAKMRYARYRVMATVIMSMGTGTTLYASYDLRLQKKMERSSQEGLATEVIHAHTSAAGNTVAYVSPVGEPKGSRIMVISSGLAHMVREGDTLILSESPQLIGSPLYSFEFDQSAYYRSLGITHRTFVRNDNVIYKPNKRVRAQFMGELRGQLVERIQQYVSDANSAAILSAMLLGDKTELSADIKRTYSTSGAMHILAISGLHIGIIASLLILITGKPSRSFRQWVGYAKGIFLLLTLWSYIWLVGFPASACRAGGMFSLYIIGSVLRRRSHPLNILGGTGVVALIVDPSVILSVGFQFSYLALIGILTVGLPLYRMMHFRLKAVQYIWGTIAISIGAQFLLIPLLAYYFNEISTMSALSSLVAIPAAYAIIGGGLLLTVSSFIAPPLASLLGHYLGQLISFLTDLLASLGSHALSTISRIYLTGTEATVLLLMLLLLSTRITTGQTLWIKAILPLALTFLILHSTFYVSMTYRPTLTFYRAGSSPALELLYRGRSYNFGLEKLSAFAQKARDKNRLSSYVRSSVALDVRSSNFNASPLRIDFHCSSRKPPEGDADYHIYPRLPYRIKKYITSDTAKTSQVVDLSRGAFQIQLQ